MLAHDPRASAPVAHPAAHPAAQPAAHRPSPAAPDEPPRLDAPEYLVQRYLELTAQKKQLDDQIAYVRAELEMIAAPALREASPRARFVAPTGIVNVRTQPTCVFDRGEVARTLQRTGHLADVAVLQGPTLARYLASNPEAAARLGGMVRYRNTLVMTTAAL
jgi:hypothetical protein